MLSRSLFHIFFPPLQPVLHILLCFALYAFHSPRAAHVFSLVFFLFVSELALKRFTSSLPPVLSPFVLSATLSTRVIEREVQYAIQVYVQFSDTRERESGNFLGKFSLPFSRLPPFSLSLSLSLKYEKFWSLSERIQFLWRRKNSLNFLLTRLWCWSFIVVTTESENNQF